jgi:hypothetical protein
MNLERQYNIIYTQSFIDFNFVTTKQNNWGFFFLTQNEKERIFFFFCYKQNKNECTVEGKSSFQLSIITARLNASCNVDKSVRVRISALTA